MIPPNLVNLMMAFQPVPTRHLLTMFSAKNRGCCDAGFNLFSPPSRVSGTNSGTNFQRPNFTPWTLAVGELDARRSQFRVF